MWWHVNFMGRGATTHRRVKNGGTTLHGGNPNKLTEAWFINVGANAQLRGSRVRRHSLKRLGGEVRAMLVTHSQEITQKRLTRIRNGCGRLGDVAVTVQLKAKIFAVALRGSVLTAGRVVHQIQKRIKIVGSKMFFSKNRPGISRALSMVGAGRSRGVAPRASFRVAGSVGNSEEARSFEVGPLLLRRFCASMTALTCFVESNARPAWMALTRFGSSSVLSIC